MKGERHCLPQTCDRSIAPSQRKLQQLRHCHLLPESIADTLLLDSFFWTGDDRGLLFPASKSQQRRHVSERGPYRDRLHWWYPQRWRDDLVLGRHAMGYVHTRSSRTCAVLTK